MSGGEFGPKGPGRLSHLIYQPILDLTEHIESMSIPVSFVDRASRAEEQPAGGDGGSSRRKKKEGHIG